MRGNVNDINFKLGLLIVPLAKESNLTPELTGRAHNTITAKLTMKGKLIRAPVE
jgi:hypothetical protein